MFYRSLRKKNSTFQRRSSLYFTTNTMFMTNKNREERRKCMAMLKFFFEKLHTGFSLLPLRKSALNDDVEYVEERDTVPDDVKEGHFAVFAAEDGKQERFIVELGCLSSPAFIRLLDQAEEEFGFQQNGALVVPCQPQELQKILMERRKKSAAAGELATRKVKIIESRQANEIKTDLSLMLE